jgi:hypothetical protein
MHSLPQMFDPFAFRVYFLLAKIDDFGTPTTGSGGIFYAAEIFVVLSEPIFAAIENVFLDGAIEEWEEANAEAEGLAGTRGFLAERTQGAHKFLFATGGERIEFAGLAAFAIRGAPVDPTLFHEALQQRIHEIVVHLAVAGDEADLLFEGIAMLRPLKQHRQQD